MYGKNFVGSDYKWVNISQLIQKFLEAYIQWKHQRFHSHQNLKRLFYYRIKRNAPIGFSVKIS